MNVNYRSLLSEQDYYPGGMVMPGRSFSSSNYDFGYQGSLKDDEISGIGNNYTTYFRELEVRLNRWWTTDPKSSLTPWESPYLSMGGNPTMYNDPYGDYLWGLIGSTAEQRQSAKAVASETDGDIQHFKKKSIHVDYSIAYSEFESGVIIESKTARFRENGLLETGSALIDDWNDQKLEALNQGREISWNESGLQSKYVYDGIKPDYTLESVVLGGIASKGLELGINAVRNSASTTLFRSVAQKELDDIALNGLRTNPVGGYETGKLFATTADDASKWSKLNYKYDATPKTIIQVRVSNSIIKQSYHFTADGMKAISVDSRFLSNISKVKPLNLSNLSK